MKRFVILAALMVLAGDDRLVQVSVQSPSPARAAEAEAAITVTDEAGKVHKITAATIARPPRHTAQVPSAETFVTAQSYPVSLRPPTHWRQRVSSAVRPMNAISISDAFRLTAGPL